MHALFTAVQAVQTDNDGLTVAEVIANVPHDPASIFTYLLLIVAFGGILWVGRPRKAVPPESSQ
jgi:hypothetical protein